MKKPKNKIKLKYSIATYREDGELICDLEELAKHLQHVGNVPEKLNLTKATEIALLSRYVLSVFKDDK